MNDFMEDDDDDFDDEIWPNLCDMTSKGRIFIWPTVYRASYFFLAGNQLYDHHAHASVTQAQVFMKM